MNRKLDVAIAEALGKHVIESEYWPHYIIRREDGLYHVPYYSSDGNAMLELDREMRERGWRIYDMEYGGFAGNGYAVQYTDGKTPVFAVAEAMPKVIALAAYKALTGKEWQDD